ncbi:nucleotide pyrophosphohydrolase [Ornithinimicrobium sp. Arc0846-15]|nr:nucleotide pyrophosphohydrolase [Ornithinimicrobium laminariae]
MPNAVLLEQIRRMVTERDWAQFHTPRNLAQSISIEAGELLECFQWDVDPAQGRVADELADVVTYCYLLADRMGVDVDELVAEKLARTEEKYPVDRAKGVNTKYDQL